MSGTEQFDKTPHEMIAELSEANGWGIHRLAAELDIDAAHATRLRAGKTGVGPKTAHRLARAFPETTKEQWLVAAAKLQAQQVFADV